MRPYRVKKFGPLANWCAVQSAVMAAEESCSNSWMRVLRKRKAVVEGNGVPDTHAKVDSL